jgi:hypothetical protein
VQNLALQLFNIFLGTPCILITTQNYNCGIIKKYYLSINKEERMEVIQCDQEENKSQQALEVIGHVVAEFSCK